MPKVACGPSRASRCSVTCHRTKLGCHVVHFDGLHHDSASRILTTTTASLRVTAASAPIRTSSVSSVYRCQRVRRMILAGTTSTSRSAPRHDRIYNNQQDLDKLLDAVTEVVARDRLRSGRPSSSRSAASCTEYPGS